MTRKSLRGRRVLLTGASTGIGRVLARLLADEGAVLAVAARRESLLEELADEIAAAGNARPETLGTDLSRSGAAGELAEQAVRALGGVDLLINNAGASAVGAQSALADGGAARASFEINFWAPVALAAALSPAMREQGEGDHRQRHLHRAVGAVAAGRVLQRNEGRTGAGDPLDAARAAAHADSRDRGRTRIHRHHVARHRSASVDRRTGAADFPACATGIRCSVHTASHPAWTKAPRIPEILPATAGNSRPWAHRRGSWGTSYRRCRCRTRERPALIASAISDAEAGVSWLGVLAGTGSWLLVRLSWRRAPFSVICSSRDAARFVRQEKRCLQREVVLSVSGTA